MSIYDKTDHIDQLAQWWENAEEGVINEGDRLIYREGEDYDFRTAAREDAGTSAEKEHGHGWAILARAPEPKPAWHDAVAVMARLNGAGIRHALIRDGRDRWITMYGGVYMALELSDVTPLIEAKVTEEMVVRAVDGASVWTSAVPNSLARAMLTAALGLEAE